MATTEKPHQVVKKGKRLPRSKPVTPFREGFGRYLLSGEYGDVVLRCEGKEYLVHRIILAYSSEYFAGLLLSNFSERHQHTIDLKLPDPAGVFPLLLNFLYQGL